METLGIQKKKGDNAVQTLENLLKTLGVSNKINTLTDSPYTENYPSLLWLTDVLSKLGIKSLVIDIKIDTLQELALPVVAHSFKEQEKFILVTEVSNSSVTFHDSAEGWRVENIIDFEKHWSGITLLVELDETNDKEEKFFSLNRIGKYLLTLNPLICLLFTLPTIMFYVSTKIDFSIALPICTSLLGAFISCLLIFLDVNPHLRRKFCSTSGDNDCQAVLSSPLSSLFGTIKMSEVGLFWFLGNSLILASCFSNNIIALVSILNLLSIPYVAFSVLYQKFVIGKWCTLCLSIQIVLMCNASTLYKYANFLIIKEELLEIKSLQQLIISFGISSIIVFILNNSLRKRNELSDIKNQLIKLKSNIHVFNALCRQGKRVGSIINNSSAKESSIYQWDILVVTNPTCIPCAITHKILSDLSSRGHVFSHETYFFVGLDNKSDEGYKVAKHILSMPSETRNKALLFWFNNHNYESLVNKYPSIGNENSELVLNEQYRWAIRENISRTPTLFVNGYPLPEYYGVEDVINFIKK